MTDKMLKAPSKYQKFKIRILILIGFASIINFFYWFLDFSLIEDHVLYWLLMILIFYDTFRLIYIWYHYWDISVPQKPKTSIRPTVDVLTTYFPGEPKDMLKQTLMAIQDMDYEHTTYLCDEANDPELKEFCQESKIIHVTRNNRNDAKAGNINNALKQASGEICLILDPDHIPHQDFLSEVIPYFADPTIGFVQTVQTYYNLHESYVARAAAEQTFHFYGPVMMCMNSYGTVNAIGANCVFRRSALDSIGGHAAGLSEDMHTAMKLHAKGWKSIYVPKLLSAGLTPATLTSYFKQQLKWSRGTFELLVTSYPKLFSKFTWRQKLHYGVLPFHYFTGLIFLISLLIPIISLLTSSTPWNGNVINFGLIVLPVLVSIMGIRFYVQKWVINKGERGTHLLGGLLMQITWTIYLMGLFYTLIRKKVPYLPTDKDDEEKTSFYIVLPNLIFGLICIFAIVYGLYRDFTPFSLFMSGFALWNAIIMFYTLRFAYRLNAISTRDRKKMDKDFNRESKFEKYIFTFWQRAALVVLGLVLLSSVYLNGRKEEIKYDGLAHSGSFNKPIKYLGVFAPIEDDGMSDLSKVEEFSKSINQDMDIVSFYLAWDKDLKTSFPEKELLQVYDQKAIPMITWEPWTNTFNEEQNFKGHVFDSIASGYFDDFIGNFAQRMKNLDKPVFLRFAHEFDNPFYPWYDDREGAEANFKKAWIHTWHIFEEHGADNVIWVYNPWKPDNVTSFFPDAPYVDWISINLLNYATHNEENYRSFQTLYAPYHDEIIKTGNFPVMLSEYGTYFDPGYQKLWLENAMEKILSNYDEIKAIIFFNSNVDNNMPDGTEGDSYLNWTIADVGHIDLNFKTRQMPLYLTKNKPRTESAPKKNTNLLTNLSDIRGVNIKNSQKWKQDYHVKTRKHLESNFEKISVLGLNTIKYTSNKTYDYNVITISKEYNLKLSFGFWIPETINFMEDTLVASRLQDKILGLVKKYKDQENIISWHLQNDLFADAISQLQEPVRSYHLSAYVVWLQKLTSEIKKLDASRPVIIDYTLNGLNEKQAKRLFEDVPGLDGLGLIIKDDIYDDANRLLENIQTLDVPYIYSDIPTTVLAEMSQESIKTNYFIRNWQDQHQIDKVTFDGVIDRKGRFKPDYFELEKYLGSSDHDVVPYSIRILKRLDLLGYPHKKSLYFAMHYDPIKGWERMEHNSDYKLEWALVKCDPYGNYLTINEVEGLVDYVLLDIPENYEEYHLRLTIIKDNTVKSTMTSLNTPYY